MGAPGGQATVAPARVAAYAVIRRVFEEGAFADRALHTHAVDLEPRDRALATRLAYGTVQRRRTLDYVLAKLSSRPLERVDPPLLAALRLGAFQLLLLDGIAAHAAVNDSVELAKRSGRGGHQLVNAVLRRTIREGPALLAGLTEDTPERAAILRSVPDWIAELWWRERGADEARAMLAQINEPPESAIRINTLKADPANATLPVRARPAGDELPEGRVLEEPFDAWGSRLHREGLVMPQSRGSMLVARMLDPRPGERVLDLCAAPGGKTTHLAALMGGEGEIVAVEAHAGRAKALKSTCELMGARIVRVEHADGRTVRERGFDRVLVDPPCSGLGTLQSRPDLRWQERRSQVQELIERQRGLLRAGLSALNPGGTLVYSVCTISRAEAQDVVAQAVADRGGELKLEATRELLPHRDGTDGFFIARLARGS